MRILLLVLIFTNFLACKSPNESVRTDGQADGAQINKEDIEYHIRNGVETSDHKEVVRLRITDPSGKGVCSGSVISRRSILTAAHCLDSNVTKVEANINGTFVAASEYKLHPQHHLNTRTTYDFLTLTPVVVAGIDLAVITFAQDLNLPVASLATKPPVAGESSIILGYGQNQDGAGAGPLRSGTVKLFRHYHLYNIDGSRADSGALIYVQGANHQLACAGDSGGPVLSTLGEVYGVTSLGAHNVGKSGTCSNLKSTTYISAIKYRDWILSTVAALEGTPPTPQPPQAPPPALPPVYANPWTNPANPKDVNNDGFVTPLDALLIVNVIPSKGGALDMTITSKPPYYYDVNGDGYLSPTDALLIVNSL